MPRVVRSLLAMLSFAPAVASGAGWSTRAPLLEAIQEVAVAGLDGKLYLVGGLVGASTSDRVQRWDPNTDTWSYVAPLPTPLHHTTATALDGKLYVVGGWSDFFATEEDRLFEYDPIADTWTERASMPTARGSPAAAALDGKLYVVGGDPGATDFAVYDPGTNLWTVLPPMPTGRQHLGAAAAGGRFYAVAGRSSLGAGEDNVDAFEVYDPVTSTWTSLPPLRNARSGLAVAGVGRFVFAFGGEGNADDPDGVFADADAYDAAIATWFQLSDMPTPRHGIGAGVLGTAVHIPGGGPAQGFALTDVHEVYDTQAELNHAVPALGPFAVVLLTAALTAAAARRRLARR